MRVPENEGEQNALIGCFFPLLLTVIVIPAFRKEILSLSAVYVVLIGFAWVAYLLFTVQTGLMITRDYWIDEDGVSVRLLKGKWVHRRLTREEIKYFGVILVISGKYRKRQIVFTKYRPRNNMDGYSIKLRGTVSFDYTPERYEQICRIFRPTNGTVRFQPETCPKE